MTRDPDLDAAIDELEFVASRIRTVEEQIVRFDDAKEYQNLAARKHELADLKADIRSRAERLGLDPRALLLVVEQAHRLKRQYRRRPSVAQMEAVLFTARELTQRDEIEAAAALSLARDAHAHVVTRGRAIDAALAHMDASR